MPLSEERRAQVLEAGRGEEVVLRLGQQTLANDTDAQDGLALLRESYDALHAPLVSAERSTS